MPERKNLTFKLPKYDVNPKKSKAMLGETEPPVMNNESSAMEIDSPGIDKEVAPLRSNITITPIERPVEKPDIEQPAIQKQALDVQAIFFFYVSTKSS